MTQSPRALVVAPTPDLAGQLRSWLGRAGFTTVVIMTDFHSARAALEAEPPDLLVSEVKLDEYNGLHLAIRLRSRGVNTPVVLIGDADPVLEAEAERAEARYMRAPVNEAALLAAFCIG